ncbi:hypothetical protein PENTCL1PPCAC_15563, partial [Pristionchus entomophagus]
SMEIYLSLELQDLILSYQRSLFIFTSLLNVVSMYCMLKQTSPNQAGIRGYILYIQKIIVIMSSVYLDLLFSPIPAFPAIARYCTGPLCTAGIRPHSLLTIHSHSSNRRVRNSLAVLFIQIAVPLGFIVIPALFLMTSLACECIPYHVTLPAFCVLTQHPLFHNLCLLTVTPTYRRFI